MKSPSRCPHQKNRLCSEKTIHQGHKCFLVKYLKKKKNYHKTTYNLLLKVPTFKTLFVFRVWNLTDLEAWGVLRDL